MLEKLSLVFPYTFCVLLDIDIDTLTPLEALLKLNEIKKIVSKK